MMFTNPLDWFSILGFAVGAIGLVIAVYQTRSMQKVREVSKQNNTERCKYVFSIVTTLAEDVRDACQIVESDCRHNKGADCATLTAKVNSILTLTVQLAIFCETLNQVHKEEFGDFVDDQLDEKLKDLTCYMGQRIICVSHRKSQPETYQFPEVGVDVRCLHVERPVHCDSLVLVSVGVASLTSEARRTRGVTCLFVVLVHTGRCASTARG